MADLSEIAQAEADAKRKRDADIVAKINDIAGLPPSMPATKKVDAIAADTLAAGPGLPKDTDTSAVDDAAYRQRILDAAEKNAAPAQPSTMSPTMLEMLATMRGGGTSSSRSGTTVQEGIPISEAAKSALERSGQEGREAATESSNAEQAQNLLAADQAKQTGFEMLKQKALQETDPDALRKQHQIDAETQKLADMREEKIDSKHFQEHMPLGKKLAWALAMGLGGFASGLRGGPNTAAEMFDHEIQRDIEAQRENRAHKLGTQKDFLASLEKRFADSKQQNAAASVLSLEILKKNQEAEMAKAKNPMVQANMKRELAATDATIAQRQAQFDEASARHVTHTSESVSSSGGAGSMPKDIAARIVTLPNGQQTIAPDAETAREYRERSAAWARFGSNANAVAALRQKHAGGTNSLMNPSDVAAAKSLAAQMKIDYQGTFGSKRPPSETEMKALDEMLPSLDYGYGADERAKIAARMAAQGQTALARDLLGAGDAAAPPSSTPTGFVK